MRRGILNPQHPSHRLLHISVLYLWLLALLVSGSGVLFTFIKAHAVNFSGGQSSVSTTVTIPALEPGETIPVKVPEGGPIYEDDVAIKPYVTVVPTDLQVPKQTKIINNKSYDVFSFKNFRPSFKGQTNIKNAEIYLTLFSSSDPSRSEIRSGVYADPSGNWNWTVPESLSPGFYTLWVVAKNPNYNLIQASNYLLFQVTSSGESIKLPGKISLPPVHTPNQTPPTDTSGQNGEYTIDAFLRVPTQFRTIAPGDELVAKVKFVSSQSFTSAVTLPVEYILESSTGETVSDTTESVSINGSMSFIKTFKTSRGLEPGDYILKIKIVLPHQIIIAEDDLKVSGPSVVVAYTTPIDYAIVYQALLLFFLFFGFAAYFEYNRVMILSDTILVVTLERFLKAIKTKSHE